MDLSRSPLTLADQAREAIVDALRIGVPVQAALEAAGVHRSTLWQWQRLGLDEIERVNVEGGEVDSHLAPYVEWCYELERARADGIVKHLKRIDKAADDPDNWKANVWLLERISPKDFGPSKLVAEAESRRVEPAKSEALDTLERRLDEITNRRRKAIDVIAVDVARS